jgi:hypothetical protein
MIQDKRDRFDLTVVRFLLECEAGSPTSVSTPPTVLAMWPNPCQAQHCHLRGLQVGNGLDSMVVGEFQHGCLGVKFGGRALGDK